MWPKFTFVALITALLSSCGSSPTNTRSSSPATSPTPVPTAVVPKNGDYPGRGKVLKVNNELGSVELDHEEIVGLMQAMQMEFPVTDVALLSGLAVNDRIDFTVVEKDGQMRVTDIKKK